MALSFELNAQPRTAAGKSAARRLRHQEDLVPAIVYGAGKDPQPISLLHKDLLRATRHEAIFSSILTLNIAGKKEQAVFKSVQRHHVKPRIMHIDFLRIKASEKLTMAVPLHFIGEDVCPGVIDGGMISRLLTTVEVRCLPAHLPQHIEVDLSHLKLDESIHLSQLHLPEGVELTAHVDGEHDAPVVNVHVPRVSQADLEAEATEAATAEAASAEAAETTEETSATEEAGSDETKSEKPESSETPSE